MKNCEKSTDCDQPVGFCGRTVNSAGYEIQILSNDGWMNVDEYRNSQDTTATPKEIQVYANICNANEALLSIDKIEGMEYRAYERLLLNTSIDE